MKNQDDEKKPQVVAISITLKTVRELLAILIWGSIFTEIFLTDVGDMLLAIAPQLETAFKYRLLIILGLIAILWPVIGNKLLARIFGYIAFYPFILVVWKIPSLFIKNWAVAIAFSPAIYQLIRAFKTNFIIGVAVTITAFVVCLSPPDLLLIPVGMVLIGIYLILHFVNRLRSAYSSSTIFTVLKGNVTNIWDSSKKYISENMPEGDPESEAYKDKLGQSLLIAYMVTTGLHFITAKLQEVIESRKLDLYFLSSLIWTFTISVISFGVIYFGLYRIDPANFQSAQSSDLLDFIGFSFSALMTSSISQIVPATGLAQVIAYIQLFVSLLLIVLLVFIILTSIREKYKKDLDDLVLELGDAAESSKHHIEQNYQITMDAVERLLLRKNEEVMKFMLGMRYGKMEAESIIESFKQQDENESDASDVALPSSHKS